MQIMITWFKKSKLMTGIAIFGYALIPISIVAYSVWVNSGTKHPVETISGVSSYPSLYDVKSHVESQPEQEPETVPTPKPKPSKPSQPVISVTEYREEPPRNHEPKEDHHHEPEPEDDEETDINEDSEEDEENTPPEGVPDSPDPIDPPEDIVTPIEI